MDQQGRHTEGTGTSAVRRPESTRSSIAWTATGRRRVVAVVLTAALGFGGAAAVDAFASGGPVLQPAADLGPAGDGLTRLVVTDPTGDVSDPSVTALQATPGVVTVQRVFDGSVLVATHDLAPADLSPVVPGADVQRSAGGSFSGSVSDPYWAAYGYNLANTGANAYNQRAVAGADVDAPTGWAAGTGAGMVLAITDSGMDTSHPDLQGALWTNPAEACGATTDTDGDGLVGDCHGWNFYSHSADVVNAGGNSHGTGVAGIAGARAGNGEGSAGVAPGVQIMPLVVGYGSTVDINAAANAIVYAVDHGADVVNASWGGPSSTPALGAALAYAGAHGVLVVAAAGNDTADRDTVPMYPASSPSPAVLTVGASTAADTVASFSAYGATAVDLFAPGQAIVSPAPGGGYVAMNGTSMAAPEVAAAVALYAAHYPDASMAQLRQQLLDDTRPVQAFAGRSVSGGRLSLTALGNTATEVQYSFTGMVAAPGTVTPQLVVSGSTPAAGAYAVRFGLGMEHLGQLYALSQQDLTLGGVTVATDDAGEAAFDLGTRSSAGPLVLSPATELAAARYVLTVQLYRDGAPAGLRFAAPLLVGQPAATPDPTGAATPPTSRAASPTSSGATGATPTATSTVTPTARPTTAPLPGGGTPGMPAPTSGSAEATTAPATTAPGSSAPGGTPTTTASSTAAPTSAGATTAAPTSAVTTGTATPTAGAPSTTGAGSTGSASPTSSGSASPSSSAGATSAPGPGGSTTYPPTGPFGLTSISPTRVSVAGGTRVTITGTAIPANAQVLIGTSSPAQVSTVSATQLVFTTPALVAGTYDVSVSVPGGTPTVLPGALTYLVVSGGTTTSPTSSAPSTTSAATTGPGAGSPSSSPAAPVPAVPVTGPHGERLVRSALFTSLQPVIWKVGCATACSGIAV